MLSSFIYLISYIQLYVALMFIKKTERNDSIILWATVNAFIIECLDVVSVLLLSYITPNISFHTISMIHFAYGIIIWVRLRFVRGVFQKYYLSTFDLVVTLLLLIITLTIGFKRFGLDLSVFRYYNGDSARHLQMALDFINNNQLSSMFFTHLGDAKLFWFFSPFIKSYQYYRLFNLYDIWLLYAGGVLFWYLIKPYMESIKMKIYGVGITIFYLFGYPLNNFLHGVEYWGAALLIICLILYALQMFTDNKSIKGFWLVLLTALNIALIVCYIMFVPIIYGGEFIYINIYLYKKNKSFTKPILISNVALFALPGIFFLQKFLSSFNFMQDGVENALNLEGKVYRNLYSNFIVMALFVVLYLYQTIKERLNDNCIPFLVLSLLMITYYFIRIMQGNVATYYYYKLYNILWLFCCYITIKSIYKNRDNLVITAYITVILFLGGVAFSNIETKVSIENSMLNDKIIAVNFFDLLYTNKEMLVNNVSDVNDAMQDAFNVAGKLAYDTNSTIPLFCTNKFWWYEYYFAITAQEIKNYKYIGEPGTCIQDYFVDNKYILVENESEIYLENIDFLSSLKVIYANEYGRIYYIGE